MRKPLLKFLIASCWGAGLQIMSGAAASAAATPQVFFSDLMDGPTSGWNGLATQGAAVSIWGINLGSSRGTSTLTVCGQTLSQDSQFAEWGSTTNPTTARGLQRITFWLNSSMTAGAGTISVATSSGASAAIPFYCRALGSNHIYFVSASGGNDSYDGMTDHFTSGTHGPWLTPGKARASAAAGDAVYFRTGIYNRPDDLGVGLTYIITFNNNNANGTANDSISFAAYPAEAAQLGDQTTPDLVINFRNGNNSYWTFSKFIMRAGTGYGGVSTSGQHSASITNYGIANGRTFDNIRIIGTDAQTYYSGGVAYAIGGAIGSVNFYFYGNYVHDCGSDTRGGPIDQKNYKAYGLYIGGYGSLDGAAIAWNEIAYNAYGHGIQLYGHTTDDWLDHVYVHDNFIHHNAMRSIVFGGGDGGTGWNGTPAGTHYNYLRNGWFYNNISVDNGAGVSSTGPYEEIIICGFGWGGNHGHYYLFNNTFYHAINTQAATLYWDSSPPDLAVFQNNINVNMIPTAPYIVAKGYSDPTAFVTGSGYNLFYGAGNGPAWSANSQNNVNPQFVNANSAAWPDFELQGASPAKDAGANTAPIVTQDFLGVLRPQGAAYDIGAFEYVSGSQIVTAPPAAPGGFRLQ